jgi:superfamily I DNA/RNA helicase
MLEAGESPGSSPLVRRRLTYGSENDESPEKCSISEKDEEDACTESEDEDEDSSGYRRYTKEQVKIITFEDSLEKDALRGQVVCVNALAGCGKTTTIAALCNRLREYHPDWKMLYLVFAKKNQDEAMASKKFPKARMEIRTTHAFVLRHYFTVDNMNKVKPVNKHELDDIQDELNIMGFVEHKMSGLKRKNRDKVVRSIARFVQKTIENFEWSADESVNEAHVYFRAKQTTSTTDRTAWRKDVRKSQYIRWAQAFFDNVHKKCKTVRDSGIAQEGITYDAYLKAAQLEGMPLYFDMVAIDEAQDMTPCQADLFWGEERRDNRITHLFGDQWQQLYRFRGARECFKSTIQESAANLHLTGSFRFGKVVAETASSVLSLLGGTKLIGLSNDSGTIQMKSAFCSGAVLCRTNNGILRYLLYEQPRKWSFLDPSAKLPKLLPWMLKLEAFVNAKKDEGATFTRRGETFKSNEEIEEYLDDEDDIELMKTFQLLHLLKEKGVSLSEFYDQIGKSHRPLRDGESPDEYTGVIVTTTHRAKGLEFKNVCIYENFRFKALQKLHCLAKCRGVDEVNLLYVAVTRCKQNLFLSQAARDFLREVNPSSSLLSDMKPLMSAYARMTDRSKDRPALDLEIRAMSSLFLL